MAKRSYRQAWESEPCFKDWLTSDKDTKRAFCNACKCSLEPHKKDLTVHALSKKHIEAIKYNNLLKKSKPLTSYYEKAIPTRRKIVELKLAAFIAQHCAISTVDALCHLLPTLDPDSELLGGLKLHRTKCTGLISNVISPCCLQELINDIGDSNFSMIIDESTSVDTKKMMCIMVRYFSLEKKSVITTFYRLIEVDGGSADTLTNAFINQLQADNLILANLVGIGVDGANVMVGEHHPFASLLKKKIPHLVVVKCVSHSLHLAAEKACSELPMELEFLVKECHSWFSCSSKRQIDYCILYETLTGKNPLKLDKLSGTRWLARISCINKILEQWDALELHFQIAQSREKCFTAKQLYSLLSDISIKLYLTFLRSVLKKITDVNQMFQSDQVDSLKLLNELNSLLLYYLSMIVPPNRLSLVKKDEIVDFKFKDFTMNHATVNFGFFFNEMASGFEKDKLLEIKKSCLSFLIVVCEEIQKRIPTNMKLLQNISFFSPISSSSQVRPNIEPLITKFKDLLGAEHIEETIHEWRVLPLQNWKIEESETAESFWAKVSVEKNALGETEFKNISKLARALLALPFSNASVERAFSLMSVVKNKLRNRLLPKTTDHLMRIRFYVKQVEEFEPSEMMLQKFNSEAVYKTSSDPTSQSIDDDVCTLFSQI